MTLPIVEEDSVPALDLPGRQLRWLMTKVAAAALLYVRDQSGARQDRNAGAFTPQR